MVGEVGVGLHDHNDVTDLAPNKKQQNSAVAILSNP